MKITVEMLEEMGACENGIEVFKDQFGNSVELTLKNLKLFYEYTADYVNWFFENLISTEMYDKYFNEWCEKDLDHEVDEESSYEECKRINDEECKLMWKYLKLHYGKKLTKKGG